MSDEADDSNIFEEWPADNNSHHRFNRKAKVKGKWVRDNEKIGSVSIEQANEIATKLTGSCIDLKLPRWSDLCTNWSKCYWMDEDDVVTTKTVCLLCRTPVFEPMFNTHMKTFHPSEDKETVKLISHLQQIRLARFYATSALKLAELETLLPSFNIHVLVEFFREIGFVVDEMKEDKNAKTPTRKRVSGKAPSLPQFKPDLDVLDKVDMVFGVTAGDAQLMADVMNTDYETNNDLYYTRAASRFGIKCDYCYACHVLVRRVNNRNHRKTAHHKVQNLGDENLIQAISQRLTDGRILKYSCANPIPMWKIQEICPNNEKDTIEKLTRFLKERGFIIDKLKVSNDEDVAWPYMVENVGQLQFSENDDDNKSSTSYSSSISSTSSTATVYEKPPVSYFIMDGIRRHEKVIESILQLEELFDQTNNLNQTQYAFLFGWASFNLVVSNGCKLSALCNLKDQDFENLQMINDTEPLALIKFDAPKTGEGGYFSSWLILDRLTYDAFVLYRKVRDRIISERGGRAHGFFFVSYLLKHLEARDADYPINQFLRMCGIEWTFRAKHLVSAVNELIVRIAEKNSPDYALHFYKQLKVRSQKQKEVMECVEPHPLLVNLKVVVQKKVRKDKIITEKDSDTESPRMVKRPRLEEDEVSEFLIKKSEVLETNESELNEKMTSRHAEMDHQLTPERGLYAYATTPPYLSTQVELHNHHEALRSSRGRMTDREVTHVDDIYNQKVSSPYTGFTEEVQDVHLLQCIPETCEVLTKKEHEQVDMLCKNLPSPYEDFTEQDVQHVNMMCHSDLLKPFDVPQENVILEPCCNTMFSSRAAFDCINELEFTDL